MRIGSLLTAAISHWRLVDPAFGTIGSRWGCGGRDRERAGGAQRWEKSATVHAIPPSARCERRGTAQVRRVHKAPEASCR
jgi:hypothetical protein